MQEPGLQGFGGNARAAALADDDPAFAERLRDLDARAAKMRTAKEAQSTQVKKVERQAKADTASLGTGLAIAYSFLGLPAVGLLLGWLVSRLVYAPVATSLGGFVGILAGCIVAFRLLQQSNKGS